jgi:hypothetical protein
MTYVGDGSSVLDVGVIDDEPCFVVSGSTVKGSKGSVHVINVISLEVLKDLPFRENVTCVAIRDSNTLLFGSYGGTYLEKYYAYIMRIFSPRHQYDAFNVFFVLFFIFPSFFWSIYRKQ